MQADTHAGVSIRRIVGVFLIAAGGLLVLDSLRMIDAEIFLRFWSILLVAIGGILLSRGRWLAGGLWLVAGIWILAYNLGWIDLEIWDLWPVIFIGIGVALVRQAFRPETADPEAPGSVASLVACFYANEKRIDSTFEGGSMTSLLGSTTLDLRRARLAATEATIDVLACCGGVEIRVPEDWIVFDRVTPIMGGIDNKAASLGDGRQRLAVRGLVLMGGVEIRN